MIQKRLLYRASRCVLRFGSESRKKKPLQQDYLYLLLCDIKKLRFASTTHSHVKWEIAKNTDKARFTCLVGVCLYFSYFFRMFFAYSLGVSFIFFLKE